MISNELTSCTFNIAVMDENGKPKIKQVKGYSFLYKNDVWYIRMEKGQWRITHPETGFYIGDDRTQGGAILRLIKGYYNNRQTYHSEAIENAKKDLIENGIELPVN